MNKKESPLKTNEFYDINKLPKGKGMTVLGISMPQIDNKQSPKNCFEGELYLMDKVQECSVGGVISYSDGLYFYSDEKASILKKRFQSQMDNHKSAFMNLVKKNISIIPSAFSFITWSQLILSCENFSQYFKELQKLYEKDIKLQNYVQKDISSTGREINNNTINYILEECLLDYLISMGKVRLQNDFVQDKEEWILIYYHGKPHRTHVYIYQKNFFKLKSTNVYKGVWYDISNKKLYEYDRLDIESFNFTN